MSVQPFVEGSGGLTDIELVTFDTSDRINSTLGSDGSSFNGVFCLGMCIANVTRIVHKLC